MKRIILNSALVALTSTAMAMEPQVFPDEAFGSISSNGKWVAGQIAEGAISIRNLETGKMWHYSSDGGSINFFTGLGKVVSDNGTVIGATKTDNACYWENGVWKELNVPRQDCVNNTGSITPDGNIICGGVGRAPLSLDFDDLMLAPALWYRQEDGSFGDPVALTHPSKDFTGRGPQYITAVSISDDGKTVGGMIMDFTGLMVQPVIFKCDDAGSWSYQVLGSEFLNPNNMVFPKWPGGLPSDILMPTQEWFMDQEQIDAFVEAFNEWDNTGDPPRYQDFMTPEQIAQYDEAMAAYLEIVIPWQESYNEFMDAYYNCLVTGSSFVFNNIRISPDGKYAAVTSQLKNTETGMRTTNTPIVFDLETGEYKIFYSQPGVLVSDLSADYSILAYEPAPGADIGTRTAYIFPQMSEEMEDLCLFIGEQDQEIADWMEDYMTHEVAMRLGIFGTIETEDKLCSGIPVATPDLGIISCYNSTLSWMDYDEGEVISFVFPTGIDPSGVESFPSESEYCFNVLSDGTLVLTGEFGSIEVFDISGKKVFAQASPTNGMHLPLETGIYILRAVDANGTIHDRKVAVKF